METPPQKCSVSLSLKLKLLGLKACQRNYREMARLGRKSTVQFQKIVQCVPYMDLLTVNCQCVQ